MITQGRGKKFDLQLSAALVDERRLADLFQNAVIERHDLKLELKSESWQWERTGNICVEFEHNGRPSGIAATEADYWVHELKRDGESLLHLFIAVPRLRDLCREAYRGGRWRNGAGDDGLSKVVLLRLMDLLA